MTQTKAAKGKRKKQGIQFPSVIVPVRAIEERFRGSMKGIHAKVGRGKPPVFCIFFGGLL